MRRGMRRRALAAGIAGCLVVGVIVGAASAASAAVIGPYNIDGTVPDAGATSYTDPNGNTKELGPLNSSTTKIGVIHNDALPTLDLTKPERPGGPEPGVARDAARQQQGLPVLRVAA
ncbi:hypothetical protein [Microbacterium kyungheense]